MLMLKGVSKIFGSPDNGAQQVKALEDVSLEVGAGEFFSIIGSQKSSKLSYSTSTSSGPVATSFKAPRSHSEASSSSLQ